jgi:hypothetical protein
MAQSRGTLLAALGFTLAYGTTAWAQAAARPDDHQGSSLLLLIILLAPLILILCFLIPAARRAKRNMVQIERSLRINDDLLALAKEQVALQAETNRLLRQVVESLGRNRSDSVKSGP